MKVGDTKLDSMETGSAIVRAVSSILHPSPRHYNIHVCQKSLLIITFRFYGHETCPFRKINDFILYMFIALNFNYLFVYS